jgi:hypothetical protein
MPRNRPSPRRDLIEALPIEIRSLTNIPRLGVPSLKALVKAVDAFGERQYYTVQRSIKAYPKEVRAA